MQVTHSTTSDSEITITSVPTVKDVQIIHY